MSPNIKAYFWPQDGIGLVEEKYDIDELPDTCPICHCKINPILRYGLVELSYPAEKLLQYVFHCPNKKCLKLFISIYIEGRGYNDNIYHYRRSYPYVSEDIEFEEIIKKFSPDFCFIYNEANRAEDIGLKNICGAGYRKSLEFLIKDYLINSVAIEKEKVIDVKLSICIENYIDLQDIKDCAKRAAWLGNDEVHYFKKWEDKDLKDLKALIDLTVNWIEIKIRSKKYLTEMPKPKK